MSVLRGASYSRAVLYGRSAECVVARCRGLPAEGPDADDHYRQALDLHGPGGRPFDAARTRLRTALETVTRMGATPSAERARAELIRLRDLDVPVRVSP